MKKILEACCLSVSLTLTATAQAETGNKVFDSICPVSDIRQSALRATECLSLLNGMKNAGLIPDSRARGVESAIISTLNRECTQETFEENRDFRPEVHRACKDIYMGTRENLRLWNSLSATTKCYLLNLGVCPYTE